MEVVPMSGTPTRTVGLPFSKRNVEEWSRLDRLTGIMEKAKIETDHWAAMTNNAAHNYGKVVDSRERNTSDGSLQERQRKEMEVFQTKVPGGSMQVIRTQTITMSSKKWSSTGEKGFEDLELPVNSLDLSSQKIKGSVGRSGSIGGRRPPSRPRSLISQSSNTNDFGEESSVSRLCHRLHEQARQEMYTGFSNFTNRNQSFNGLKYDLNKDSEPSGVVITEMDSKDASEDSPKNSLIRQKSCSNENLSVDVDNENSLKRSSKVRRSLQFHKQSHLNSECDSNEDFDWASTKSLKERAAEIENLLRHGSSTYTPQAPDKTLESLGKARSFKPRDSFVSAETLKEVRERLKKPNSNDSDLKDDGIVTEKEEPSPTSKVKCFVYGMESMINGKTNRKTNINGTGSLESRSSNKSSTNTSRSSEWYRRRKSYGFEQVDEPEKFEKFNNKKNHIDSSTDSGICQSSETMGIPSWNKNLESWNGSFADTTKTPLSTVVTVRSKNEANHSFQSNRTSSLYEKSVNSVYLDSPADTFSIQNEDIIKDKNKKKSYLQDYNHEPSFETAWTRKSPIPVHKVADARENLKSSLRSAKNPWISQLRGTKLGDRNWASDEQEDADDNKRQSDSSDKQSPNFFGREDGGKSDSDLITQKKNKKVEFCKTEVHFAAESGKFNIVETDGKPPPNDIFRRRRRSTGSSLPKNPQNLAETKFGDSSFEKKLLTSTDNTESISEKIEAELKELSKIVIEALPQTKEHENNVEVKNSLLASRLYDVAEEPVESGQNDNLKPRSILKNYRKSFLLGETEDLSPSKLPDSYDRPSGARSPIPTTTPVWRSTVVLRNKRFDDVKRRNEGEKKLYSSDGETELQIRIRNLRKTDSDQRKLWDNYSYVNNENKPDSPKRRSLPDDILLKHSFSSFGTNGQKMSISNDEMPSLSVAERIKQVEELKSNNYSTKINFRSGEMTIVQNGTTTGDKILEENKKTMTSWVNQRRLPAAADSTKEEKTSQNDRPLLSCDTITTSNPPVMRFSTHDDKTDNQKYQTTRILINFETSAKGESTSKEKLNKNNSNKTTGRLINSYGSWSSGMRKDLGRYLNDLKSTSLVKETIHVPEGDRAEATLREDIPKPSKPVHEIIDQFDSLSIPTKNIKEKRRKTVPITYKQPKEYTHSDLEEELKNFTENLDKDFRDIYEEEIGSLRKLKSLRESKIRATPKIENVVRPIILNRPANYFSMRSSSDEGSKKSSLQTSSRDNYDTDDSDLLADEEVRSYMSTGHGGSDSETEGAYGSSSSRKSFEDSIQRFKKLESQMKGVKEIKSNVIPIQPKTVYSYPTSTRKPQGAIDDQMEQPKVASIALKYEDDPFFSKTTYKNSLNAPRSRNSNTSSNDPGTDTWERTSNSSSTVSNKPRERVSYLNGLSLSEKYSKYLQRSSNSSLDTVSEFTEKTDSGRRGISSVLTKPENYLLKSKSETETRHSKCKYSSRNTLENQSKDPEHVEDRKETKILKEEIKPSRYNLRSGFQVLESSGHRVKSNSEKLSTSRKSTSNTQAKAKERSETDSVILEELKRAADQIMVAVNGYTDNSSHVSSSEDDERSRRIIRKDKMSNLGTISEGKRVTKTEMRKSITTSNSKRTGNQSSASSLESLTKESIRPTRESKPASRHKHGEGGKPVSSRTTRLLQRASSREALMPQPSSSEDIPSYLEQAKKRVVRRQKSSSTMKAETAQESKTSSRSKSKSKSTESSSTTRTRDRKPEKLSITRSSRSSHAPDGDRTKPTTRRTVIEKSEVEATRRRRSQHVSSREEHATIQNPRKKVTAVKKPEIQKASHPT